ncbi:unnamed protein product [Caretta caretta]
MISCYSTIVVSQLTLTLPQFLLGYFSKPPTNALDISDLENKSTSITNPCEGMTATPKDSPDTASQPVLDKIEIAACDEDTRRFAHAQTTKALQLNYENIQESLRKLADDPNRNPNMHNDAQSLVMKMDKLEIAFLCNLWNTVLQRFQATSCALQAVDLDLPNAVKLVGSLKDFVAGLRVQFDSFETIAKQMTPRVSQQYKPEKHHELKHKKQDEFGEMD